MRVFTYHVCVFWKYPTCVPEKPACTSVHESDVLPLVCCRTCPPPNPPTTSPLTAYTRSPLWNVPPTRRPFTAALEGTGRPVASAACRLQCARDPPSHPRHTFYPRMATQAGPVLIWGGGLARLPTVFFLLLRAHVCVGVWVCVFACVCVLGCGCLCLRVCGYVRVAVYMSVCAWMCVRECLCVRVCERHAIS